MAGYIGNKAAFLSSTSGADIDGNMDVDGTVTADGLTVDGNAPAITFNDTNDVDGDFYAKVNTGSFRIQSVTDLGVATERLNVSNNGDISFYEDTGTTAKFFWDASAESVSIGGSSNDLSGGTSGSFSRVKVFGDVGDIQLSENGNDIAFSRGSTNYLSAMNSGGIITIATDTATLFSTNGSERMRIDSSGNLLVGTTSTQPAVDNDASGISLQNVGTIHTSGNYANSFNRTSSDGDIVQFRKGGSMVGRIGVIDGNNTYIQGASNHGGFGFSDYKAVPFYNGTYRDNSMDLGDSSFRFDDIYATNGTIQTSDRNEKQQIASLTDAEITAAKAISKLFKTFKWNDSVTEKGDAARTHTGVIAQQVETAMTDAGLDASDYAFFISTTWWETQTDVPAIEADEENGVEAQEAYTRTDTYDTAEEAPEGATERNRKGIRYPQLLSFVAAATEQRLASIETRLDALEA